MSEDDDKQRRPRVFQLDDRRLQPAPPDPFEAKPELSAPAETAVAEAVARRKTAGWSWGAVFLSAIGGLISLAVGVWVADFVAALLLREGWLGYTAMALALVALFAAVMIALRETLGFLRLARVAAIRTGAEAALIASDKRLAATASSGVERLFSGREELSWGSRRLAEHRREVLDARELLILTEREMLEPLDRDARALIAASVRRVGMLTAVSPSAILDVAFVALENLRMLRRLATLYGGRPGFLGSLRLARLVLGHMALSGGVALGEDVIQQLIGHGLTARLSRRLGEGIMNGAFTGRIGIAAIDLCRPLPFLEQQRPRLRDFIAALKTAQQAKPPEPQAPVRQ